MRVIIIEGNSLLQNAAHCSTSDALPDALNLLIKRKIDINAATWHGVTPVHYAASNRAVNCIKLLLKNNCDVNAQEFRGETPLMEAVKPSTFDIGSDKPKKEEKIVLLTKCSSVDNIVVDKYGRNCIHFASIYKNDFALKILRRKAQFLFNKADNDGNHPLHLAAMQTNINISKLIVETPGVDINFEGYCGRSPLHFALFHEN